MTKDGKKRRRGGSGKGSPFERRLCDRLSEWWLGKKGRRVFWRTSSSGATATVRGQKGLHANGCGDLCSIDPCSAAFSKLLVVEAKRGYNRATIQDLLDKPAGAALQPYESWFAQVEEACRNADTFSWLLIVQRDRREPLVFLPCELAGALSMLGCGLLMWKEAIQALPLELFLTHVRPEQIKHLAEECTW